MSIETERLEPTMLDSEPVAAEPAPPRAEPVPTAERVAAVDVLRGFALLGILAMNIVGFAWPGQVYGDPTRGGGFEGLDRVVWIVNHLVFEMKMWTIFTMLFGAGLVLMSERADARGAALRGVYYRRVLWLIVIGLIHSYLIWDGDVLVSYGQCGLLLYLFRRKSPKTLIIVGLACTLILVPLVLGIGAAIDYMKHTAARVEAKLKEGQQPTSFERRIQRWWAQLQPNIKPDEAKRQENYDEEMRIMRGGYLGIVQHRAKELWIGQTIGFLLGGLPAAGGRMLLGMGLMKLGVFAALRSRRFYLGMMLLGYGLGLPLVSFDAYALIQHNFDYKYILHGGIFYNFFGSLGVALGHVGAIMLICQSGVLTGLTRRLAAVGRMALTNYLMHSIVCTTLFYGYGFDKFGQINRTGLALIVLAIWTFQLWLSPVWLKFFRFGPAEWLWRSLTYWRVQPMVRRAAPALA
jgi:uncharacterized protein